MPETLRIAMLGIRGIPANYGGFETCAQEVATRLAERGHQVTVYGRSHHQPPSPATHHGVQLVTLPTVRQKFLDTPVHTLLAAAHAIRQPYDVIIIFGVGNSPQSWLLKRLGRNVILNVDGLDWQRDKWPPIARWLLKRAEQLAGQSAQTVITDSHHVQRHFKRSYNHTLAYVPYGASPPPRPAQPGTLLANHPPTTVSRTPDPDSRFPTPDSRLPSPDILQRLNLEPNQYILYVGRLEPENRVHDLIQAAHLANLPIPTTIVGDAPYATPYKTHLQHLSQPHKQQLPSSVSKHHVNCHPEVPPKNRSQENEQRLPSCTSEDPTKCHPEGSAEGSLTEIANNSEFPHQSTTPDSHPDRSGGISQEISNHSKPSSASPPAREILPQSPQDDSRRSPRPPMTRSFPDPRLPTPDPRQPTPNIRLVGPHYGPDYWTLLRNARIYVFPVASAGTHPALIEAMATGNLVLVRDTPDNRSVGGDTILYFTTVKQLADLMRRAIDQPELITNYGPKAAQRANERFNWDRVTDQYERLAQTLTHPPTTPSRQPSQPTDPHLTQLLTTLTFPDPNTRAVPPDPHPSAPPLRSPSPFMGEGLGVRVAPDPGPRIPDPDQFRRLAAMHGIGPLLGQRVERGQLTISPEIDSWLIQQHHHNIARHQRITTILQTTLNSLTAANIPATPLKGAALLLHTSPTTHHPHHPRRDAPLARLNPKPHQSHIQSTTPDSDPEPPSESHPNRSRGISPENRGNLPSSASKDPIKCHPEGSAEGSLTKNVNSSHPSHPLPSLKSHPDPRPPTPDNRSSSPNPEPRIPNPDLPYRPMADIDLLITTPHNTLDLALANAGYTRPHTTGTGLSGLNWKHHTYHPINPPAPQTGDMSPDDDPDTPLHLGEHPNHPCTIETHQHVLEAHRRISWDMSPEIQESTSRHGQHPIPSLPAITLHLTVHASVAALDSRLRIIHIYDLQQIILRSDLSAIHLALQHNDPAHIARFLYPALRLCQRHGLDRPDLNHLIDQLKPHLPPHMASWIDHATFEQLAWTHRHQPPSISDPKIWAKSSRERLQLARTTLLPAPRDLDALGHQGSGPRAILSWYPRHIIATIRQTLRRY